MSPTNHRRPSDEEDVTDYDAAALAERVLASTRRPVDWARLTADEVALVWAALDNWVRWLVVRYCLDHRDVPPCWYRHCALVEELSALRSAHLDAFHPARMPTGPAEWHTTFGNARGRMREWAARTGCRPGQHRDDLPPPWASVDDGAYGDELRSFVLLDCTRRKGAGRALLEQLAE